MIEDDGAKDVREAWWSELRDEVKAHSKALGCQYVLGYSEHISIEEELVVLHCTGTACNLDLSAFGSNSVFATDVAAVSGGGVVGGGDGTGLITNGDVGYDDEFDASEPSGGGGDVTANSMATGDLILGSLPPVSPASPSRRRGNSHAAAKNISLIMDDNDNTSKSINNPAATKPPSSAAAAAAVASPSSPRSVGVQPLITKYPTLKYRQSAATMPHSTSDGADVGGQMYDEPNSMALVTSSRSGPRMSKRRKRKMQLSMKKKPAMARRDS